MMTHGLVPERNGERGPRRVPRPLVALDKWFELAVEAPTTRTRIPSVTFAAGSSSGRP